MLRNFPDFSFLRKINPNKGEDNCSECTRVVLQVLSGQLKPEDVKALPKQPKHRVDTIPSQAGNFIYLPSEGNKGFAELLHSTRFDSSRSKSKLIIDPETMEEKPLYLAEKNPEGFWMHGDMTMDTLFDTLKKDAVRYPGMLDNPFCPPQCAFGILVLTIRHPKLGGPDQHLMNYYVNPEGDILLLDGQSGKTYTEIPNKSEYQKSIAWYPYVFDQPVIKKEIVSTPDADLSSEPVSVNSNKLVSPPTPSLEPASVSSNSNGFSSSTASTLFSLQPKMAELKSIDPILIYHQKLLENAIISKQINENWSQERLMRYPALTYLALGVASSLNSTIPASQLSGLKPSSDIWPGRPDSSSSISNLLPEPIQSHSLPRAKSKSKIASNIELESKQKAQPQIKNKSSDKFSCNDCGNTYSTKGNLKTHQKKHTDVAKCSCEQCGEMFATKSSLRRHQTLHTSKEVCNYKECGEMFPTKISLSRHQTLHTSDEACNCKECGKMFSTKRSLSRHQKIHTGEQKCSCEECGMNFTAERYLKQHEKTHSAYNDYFCNSCGAGYATYDNLQKHLIKIHNMEKMDYRSYQAKIRKEPETARAEYSLFKRQKTRVTNSSNKSLSPTSGSVEQPGLDI